MGIPQVIVIVLYAMSWAMTCKDVADEKAEGSALFNKTLVIAGMMGLLWWGGFFS